MTRQQYQTKPYEKLMEAYQRFDGGLNTISAPDAMLDTELTDLLNTDIGERGSLKRRHGLRRVKPLPAGKKQGYFRFYKTDGSFDEIFAIAGKFYMNDNSTDTPIWGMDKDQYQKEKLIDAVQFNNALYIATGTKLVRYTTEQGFWAMDHEDAGAYQPTTMEMTYIGSNILVPDPESHLKDTVGLVASIDYVLPSYTKEGSRYRLEAKVFSTNVTGEEYEFALHYRNINKRGEAWPDTHPWAWAKLIYPRNVFGGNPSSPGEYELKAVMRKKGTTAILSEWEGSIIIPETEEAPTKSTYTIHKCTRVTLHWNRLMLYGDPDNPTRLYMSHLNTPNYFPALLNLEFDNPRREPLTTILHYRNSLVAFTKTSTQALYGTGPSDYRRVMLHTDLGCISPNGAAVMKNHIGFLSMQGIYALKTMGLTDDKATVEKLDIKIANIVPLDTDAIAIFNDSQLQFTFPSRKTRLRFYHDLGAWTKDESELFSFAGISNIDGELFCLVDSTTYSGLYVFDKLVYNDHTYNYTDLWESKYLSFGQPYHKKKLKEIHILTAPKDVEMNCKVYIYADEEAVITPDSGYADIVDGAVVWVVTSSPNFHVSAGTTFGDAWELGDNVLGKNMFALNKLKLSGNCKRTRVRVVNTEPNENQFIGFAYIFKARRPK